MTKKKLIICICFIVIEALLLAFGFVALGHAIKGSGSIQEAEITGTWTEDSTNTDIVFDENGVFQVAGKEAGKYEKDAERHILTLTYDAKYGGKVLAVNYDVTSAVLTLKIPETGEIQTYQKKEQAEQSK